MSLIETLQQIKFEAKKITDYTEMLPYTDLIAYRVIIARLGDSDNNRWWNMAILSVFGRQHLYEFLPKTIQSKRIPLAFAACAKVESRVILNKQCISLFSLGFSVEREISRLLSKNIATEANIERILDITEGLKCKLEAPGWTQQFSYPVPISSKGAANERNISALSLGILDKMPSKESLQEVTSKLFASYGNSCLGRLVIPFYEVIP
jgi:hypothetical protein